MKADDPRLLQAGKEMDERIRKYDERMLTVIKNHLGCEDFLNQLLSAGSRRWKRRMFGGKLVVGQQINPPEITPAVWKLLEAGNQLRNAVAHGDDESTIAARMAEFRQAYLKDLTPEQQKGVKDLDDTRMVVLAFAHCGGYLVVAVDAEKERRKKKAEAKAQARGVFASRAG